MIAALEAAEAGKQVVLVENVPIWVGARLPALQILPQAVFPRLWSGDQPAPRQCEKAVAAEFDDE